MASKRFIVSIFLALVKKLPNFRRKQFLSGSVNFFELRFKPSCLKNLPLLRFFVKEGLFKFSRSEKEEVHLKLLGLFYCCSYKCRQSSSLSLSLSLSLALSVSRCLPLEISLSFALFFWPQLTLPPFILSKEAVGVVS